MVEYVKDVCDQFMLQCSQFKTNNGKKCGHYSSYKGQETLSLNVQHLTPRGERNQDALLPRHIWKK